MSMCGSLLKYFAFSRVCLWYFIIHVVVKAQDEYVKVSAEGKLGENAVISCHISPESSNITWLFNGHQINISGRLKQINQNLTRPEKDNDGNVKRDVLSNITISNVTLNDVGHYTCLAQWTNEVVSNDTKLLDLRFEGKLVGKNPGPIKIRVSKDGSFNKLWCVFEVYNVTEMKWWKRNSNEFEPVFMQANVVNLKQINGSYSLNITQPTENGTYVCEVYDKVKMQSIFGETDIIVYDKPRVIIDQVVAVNTTELFINWTVFAYNSKIVNYELWYRNAMEPKSNFMMSNKKVDVNSSSHILGGLYPSTNYSVKLVVRTEYNISQPDVYRNIVATLDKEPVFVPNISINGFSATSVTIGWEKPPEDIAHLIHYYLLEARKKDHVTPKRAYHSSDSRNLPYMFDDLEPYSTYIFRVCACSEYTKRCGNWSKDQEAVTLDGIPGKPDNVSVHCDRQMMNVSWSPPLKPNAEIKGYQLELRGNAKFRDSNGAMQLATWGPTSKFMTNDSRNARFEDLKPNTNYVVKVSAMTRIRRRGEEAIANCVTMPAPPPAPPQPLWRKIYESGKYMFKTYLQRVSERNGPICCYRVYMVRLLPDSDWKSLPKSPKELPVIKYKDAHANEPVFGAYATDVFTNDEFPLELIMGDGTTFVAKTFLPQCVARCLHKPVSLPSAPPVKPPTTTPAEEGEIDVTTMEVPILEQKTRRHAELQPMDDLIADEPAPYVDNPDIYLNVDDGALNSTANYTMFVELIPGTDDEAMYSEFLNVLIPAPNPIPAAPNAAIEIALQVTCAIAAAVLLGMIIFCIMQTRRSRKLPPHAALEMSRIPNILRYFWPTIRRQQLVSQTPPDLPAIAKEDLPAAYAERQADSDYGFQKEFELLQMLPECFSDRTTYASEARENQSKNRYPDIKAYDQTRVKLSQIDGINGSDYINANFVMGYQERKQFICAQGPTDTTVNDFWRMIWEHGLELIVMLTNLEEYSKVKCSKYWPDEIRGSKNFGSFTVTHVGEKRYSDYIVRELKITKQPTTSDGQPIVDNNGVAKRNGECKDGEASATTSPRETKPTESRIVKQYHFLMWKDFAAPDHAYSILKFIKRVNEAWSTLMGRPIVVHCSAGVGRTGTLVALDCLLEQLRATGQVAVFNTVAELRRQRNFLVQSLKQYVFVYRALVEYAHYGDTEITASKLKSSVDRLRNTPEGADKCLMEHEFEQMIKKPVSETSKSCAAGAAEEVRPKNRSQECLPYDRNRVILTPIPGRDFSTYINASFIEAYDNSEGFIITQDPLTSTIADFWRMVSEHNVATIVMLSEIGEGKCPRYWDDNTATYEHISVQYEESESCPYYTRRQFRVTNNKSGDVSCVRQLQYQGWPTASGAVPEVTRGLAELADAAAPHTAPLSAPMLVHCQLGTERSSLFVALCILICQLRTERRVDVNCVARKIRDQRAKTIDTFVHYEFLHRAILNYAELHNLLEDS